MGKSESKYFNTAAKMDAALMTLLEKKDFAYITVSEICKVAGVNRSTFYLHYETIGDLLEETTRNLLDDFMSHFTVNEHNITTQFRELDLPRLNFITTEYLTPYLCYIRDHRRVFATALTNVRCLGLDQVYARMFEHIFDPILARFGYLEESRPYVMAFYLNGIHAIVAAWLKGGCTLSIEEVSNIIHDCVFGRDPSLIEE